MPGENCSVFGCGSCRRTKGIGIWKLPGAKNDSYKKWRSDWLSAITKTRVMDKSFKELIAKDRVYTCERHFVCKYLVFAVSFATRSMLVVRSLHYFREMFAYSFVQFSGNRI